MWVIQLSWESWLQASSGNSNPFLTDKWGEMLEQLFTAIFLALEKNIQVENFSPLWFGKKNVIKNLKTLPR